MNMINAPASTIAPRKLGSVNWLGLWTLTAKEIRRFLKVYFQTIIAPMVTTLMFLAIFNLSVGNATVAVQGVPFAEFLAPGLIIMAMTQNAFANTSSSLIIAKVQGNIVDVLMPPLSPLEQTLGFALGGVVRGVVVGLAVALSMLVFVPFTIHSPLMVIFHGVMASLMLSLLGMIGGIWADKFDHMAAVTNFIVTPLSFLSGTFYTVEHLPQSLKLFALANPFFYMIDGFRYGFIGHADSSLGLGVLVVTLVNLGLAFLSYRMFKTGYKLKA
ncbi:MAG TPA: ABC transporter permease [Candidatus Sulfotelmatobacter sp.]|jgi:ABC-2 type transport system permease protein|nr:ABC transporter permease [Candidatus Sulfotelmatobacter sp.]